MLQRVGIKVSCLIESTSFFFMTRQITNNFFSRDNFISVFRHKRFVSRHERESRKNCNRNKRRKSEFRSLRQFSSRMSDSIQHHKTFRSSFIFIIKREKIVGINFISSCTTSSEVSLLLA